MFDPSPSPGWPFQQWPAFVFSPGSTSGGVALLSQPALLHAVEALNLSPDESLHVYQNGAIVYTPSTSWSRFEELLGGLDAVADALPGARSEQTDYSGLPEVFRSLVPLLDKVGPHG